MAAAVIVAVVVAAIGGVVAVKRRPRPVLSGARGFAAAGPVQVTCARQGETLGCQIRHTGAAGAREVCWHFVVTCRNGELVTGSACQRVQPGATEAHLLPRSSLHNARRCDTPVSTRVEQLVSRPL